MKVKVLKREDNEKQEKEKLEILTPSYIKQLNDGITYRMSNLKSSPIQEEDTVVVGGQQKSKSLSIKCR